MAKSGYVKLENWLLEFLYSSNLEHSELVVFIFLIRYTKGFKRDTVRASVGYIARGTGLCENSVRRALKNLIQKGFVQVMYEHSGSRAQILKLIYQSVEVSYTHSMRDDIPTECGTNIPTECTQDIKEDIKDKYIKDKERKTTYFSTRFSEEFETEEEFLAWMNAQEDED